MILASRLRHRYRTLLIGGGLDDGERDQIQEARSRGIETLILPSMRRRLGPLADLASLIALWRLFRRERPALVHTHTAKAGALGRVAARLAGVPIIVHTFHGHVFEGYFSPLLTRLVILAERLLARLSDAIVVLSASQHRDIVERFAIAPQRKVRTIPLGLDLESFARVAARGSSRGALRLELGADGDALVVGIVGRLVPIKNHELFIETAMRIRERLPGRDIHFVIVGEGERQAELEALARRCDIGARVHFLGWRHDIPSLMADFDLLMSTSRNEGTPVAIIEAMAAGIPVVATAVGGVGDTMDGYAAGRVVGSFDPRDLAAEAMGLLERRIPRASWGIERFGAARLVRDAEALYAELLAAKGIRPPLLEMPRDQEAALARRAA
jgi:glycosyltransferase involved in cell wall biosynthesis